MKVGTDGVLLGAWASIENPQFVLDIGSGTALITLMMAQRFPKASIQGIEIDENAFQESQQNIQNSPFSSRCQIDLSSLQNFETEQKFDLIVSNPPFFEWTHAENSTRNLARQQSDLTFEELLNHSKRLLNAEGKMAFILPYLAETEFLQLATQLNLFPEKITRVKGHASAKFKRSLLLLSSEKTSLFEDELIIELERNVYSKAYIELTKAFYLKM